MLNSEISMYLPLYISHTVRATFQDGTTLDGTLGDCDFDNQTIAVDDRTILLSELSDLEYLGWLTDYQNYKGTGVIDDTYTFKPQLLEPEQLETMKHHEFRCLVSCHLVMDSVIHASDVRIIAASHVINKHILTQKDFLYTLKDGSCHAGTLVAEENALYLVRNGITSPVFSQEDIADITRLPAINDTVSIKRKDGRTVSGLVSAAPAGRVILFSPGKLENIAYEDIEQLRFFGTVTEKDGHIDKHYLCKRPHYLHNSQDNDAFLPGARVSYVVGVNERELIAKDVMIEEVVVTPAAAPAKEYLGVILMVDLSKPDGVGYIGQQYISKSCGTPAMGDVRFGRQQLPFTYDFNYIHVVKYTLASETSHPKIVQNMTLVKTFDNRKYAKVTIDPSNTVIALPLYRAAIANYLLRDVDVICADGKVHSGVMAAYDEQSVTVEAKHSGTKERIVVPFADISDIRLYGTVSQFYPNGTGWIDNSFFFHINEMRQKIDSKDVHRGALLAFTLRNTRKGNGIDCIDLEVMREERLDVFVTDFRDGLYTVIPAAEYGTSNAEKSAFTVPYSSYNQFRDLEHCDYHAIISLQRKNGSRECIAIRTLTSTPKPVAAEKPQETVETVEEPAPAAVSMVREYRSDTIDLARQFPTPESQASHRYGILRYYMPAYPTFHIQSIYQNKECFSEAELRGAPPIASLDTSLATIHYNSGRINTSKHIYIVRFVADGDSVDYRCGVEVLLSYVGKNIRSLSVSGSELTVEYFTDRTVPEQPQPPRKAAAPAESRTAAEPEPKLTLVPGETVVVLDDLGNYILGTVAENKTIKVADGKSLPANVGKLYRFGLFTSFDESFSTGYLNGQLRFALADMETKTYNIVKAAKRKTLLCYNCTGTKVTRVERIPAELAAVLPWQSGVITDCALTPTERAIMINETIPHYLSVMSDGYISALAKANQAVSRSVFFKQVLCPIVDPDGETELVPIAVDVHSDQEQATIRYDAVKDRYLAYRTKTYAAQVEGSSQILSRLVDCAASVRFRLDEKGTSLIALLDTENTEIGESTDSEDELDDVETSAKLDKSSLIRLYLGQVNLNTMVLPGSMKLNEEGWPEEEGQMVSLLQHLISTKNASPQQLFAAVAIAKRLPRDISRKTLHNTRFAVATSVTGLLRRALKNRIRILLRDSNSVLGEYSYHVSTLLRNSSREQDLKENLYRLFLQDFCSRIELAEELNYLDAAKRSGTVDELQPSELFNRQLPSANVGQLVAHAVSLDEQSFDYLLQSVIYEKSGFSDSILQWGKVIDSEQEMKTAGDTLSHLRSMYQADKRRFTLMLNKIDGEKACEETASVLDIISGRFLNLMCRDDIARFRRLRDCCTAVVTNKPSGFKAYEQALRDSYRQILELEQAAQEHPTQETTEMLLETGVLPKVRTELVRELDALYRSEEHLPNILCVSNDPEVTPGQDSLLLLLQNGLPGQTNRQTAYNPVVHLEVLSGAAKDSFPDRIRLSAELLPGREHPETVKVDFDFSALEGDSFTLDCCVEYTCAAGFDGEPVSTTYLTDSVQLQFQVRREDINIRKDNVDNPYAIPAKLFPLTDEHMFFGRTQEIADIKQYLAGDGSSLIPGQVAIIYGQKKCGKTSLVHQIKNWMRSDHILKEQAIIVEFDSILLRTCGSGGSLDNFTAQLFDGILNRFEEAVHNHHPALERQLFEEDLEIPDIALNVDFAPSMFQKYFGRFQRIDQGKHKLVLIMDEFTLLCSSILERLDEHPEYKYIPNFIRMLSDMGFIQIVIGHAAMMRALSQLGVINHTAQFAKVIELSALKEEDARQLVEQPMNERFKLLDAQGNPVGIYGTPLGRRAVDLLLEYSGCSPSLLMMLCNRMFQYYTEDSANARILDRDVQDMIGKYLTELDIATSFDMLLTEDGDKEGFFEERPSFLYLKHISTESFHSNNGDCDINTVCPALGELASDNIRETLIDRKVLSAGNGRIRINARLFREYIRYRYGIT